MIRNKQEVRAGNKKELLSETGRKSRTVADRNK